MDGDQVVVMCLCEEGRWTGDHEQAMAAYRAHRCRWYRGEPAPASAERTVSAGAALGVVLVVMVVLYAMIIALVEWLAS